ncbi:uncharacterized protein LOC125236248 [Leguminivora glycinivorella]|uniref:uncharacterized protein LOC125236248 n=1 Tax=Leguminivora glycinivorella TaxID=1035111 RepID=UPI00200F32DD|nr:uncharacterized protein LOC125236248 [Leguminivora glycinivorella]
MRRDRHPRSRLSLRSFSVLLSGAARIYRDQVNALLKDSFSCSINPVSDLLTTRNDHTISESLPSTPETNTTETDTSSGNGNNSESTQLNTDMDELPSDDLYETITDEESTVFTVTPNSNQHIYSEDHDTPEKTRDQLIQTSLTPPEAPFDPNLPFAYIIVHDNFHSRIPSKIVFSSLSENARFLPIHRPRNPE